MKLRTVFVWLLVTVIANCNIARADGPAKICRLPSFAGLELRTREIHSLLGQNTRDPSKIKLFITRDGDTNYIQSNFLSADPDSTGIYSDNPTKIRANEASELRNTLLNIVYWGDPPPNAEQEIEKYLATTQVFVDRSMVDQHGRIDFDLDGARQLTLATDKQVLPSGEISLLKLEIPPPVLVETIDGCCLKGRPPGRGAAIMNRLEDKKFTEDDVSLLSMVVDSQTEAVIAGSPLLKKAKARSGVAGSEPWGQQLTSALANARGKTLVVLSHINGKNVEVMDARKNVLFTISVADLREKTQTAGVDLVLFGCDTAAFIDEASGYLGVVGEYNTAEAATRLASALKGSQNLADMMKKVASPNLTLVVYDEKGGNGYTGASGFAKVDGENIVARVFRLLFLQGRK